MSASTERPIRRTILLKLKSDAPPSDVEKLLAEASANLHGSPGVSGVAVGALIRDGSDFTHGISMDFESQAAIEAYRDDPVHRDLHNRYIHIIEDRLISDIRHG